ncbi:MAG: pyridoxamine 5'-phosphate oxidase family protein [Intestinibacillus sp.]
METVLQFLRECRTFYLATVEGDQPRVRPFGAVSEFEGRLYICTNNTKKVFRQMQENPKIEISGMAGSNWIRLAASVVLDERREAKAAMLEQNPSIQSMYSVDDGTFAVFYLRDATANILDFAGKNDVFTF